MDRPLRLISSNPVDALARTVEALLIVASQPLTLEELVEATTDDAERIETALGLLRERYSEGRSGIVLQKVAGGYAFGAAREAAEACARLFERPIERGLSQAALETIAIVAYLGPVSRPEIARIRGVAADSAVASLVERFRAVLQRRRRFDFDAEVQGLSRVEQAVAFLALLELRKDGEIAISQAAAFAPIRISRIEVANSQSDDGRILQWTARSA